MIIVTGTKRSGTSMWMQILGAAGLPMFGEAFPRDWGRTLRDANPEGFYESILRQGIYWRTNPHPRTGAYFFPEQVQRHAVKVFIPGLVRTDRAYIGRVIASVRPWREYCRSLRRLWTMEDAVLAERHPGRRPPPRVSPALEWWAENYMLIRDVATRRYPVHLQSYDGLLADPEGVLRRTFAWLGFGDAAAAMAAVKPERRTQRAKAPQAAPASQAAPVPDSGPSSDPEDRELEPAVIEVFDHLYHTVHAGEPVRPELLAALNATHVELAPRITEQQRAVLRAQRRRRALAKQDAVLAGDAVGVGLDDDPYAKPYEGPDAAANESPDDDADPDPDLDPDPTEDQSEEQPSW
jgi:hypothetical protein